MWWQCKWRCYKGSWFSVGWGVDIYVGAAVDSDDVITFGIDNGSGDGVYRDTVGEVLSGDHAGV